MFWLFLITVIIEIIGTIGGFGSSLFFVPIAKFWVNTYAVLSLTSILHTFSNLSKLLLFKKGIDRSATLLIGIPSVVFVILGALLTGFINVRLTDFILALFLIGFSLALLYYPRLKMPQRPLYSIVSGSLAGFLAGLVGTGGAIRGLMLTAFNLEKQAFVATSALIDTFVDLSRMIIYLYQGYLQPEYYWYIPMLAVAAFAGSYMGRIILKRISQEKFRVLVLFLIFATGITTLGQVFFK